ncbi:17443_t:CDS:1, partial [Cetraspora pellucida]
KFDDEINNEFNEVSNIEFDEVDDNEFGKFGDDKFDEVSDNEFDKNISTDEFNKGIKDEL